MKFGMLLAAVLGTLGLGASVVASTPVPGAAQEQEPVYVSRPVIQPLPEPVVTKDDHGVPVEEEESAKPVTYLNYVAVSRHKFAPEYGEAIDLIEFINAAVNQQMTYTRDIDQYGARDVWVQKPESLKGDCEDYALTKLSFLQQAGFPIISYARISMLGTPFGGHAVLEVRLPNGQIAILDNNHDQLITPSELVNDYGYRFQIW